MRLTGRDTLGPPKRRNIVAIGGGDLLTGETEPFDRELLRLAGVAHPRLLFVPTASNDDPGYVSAVEQVYGRLGCEVEALRLWSDDDDLEPAFAKIWRADAIYVGGGNTKALIRRWEEVGLRDAFAEYLDSGRPVGGVSAGAICWFRVGNSDWPQFEGIPNVNTGRLECLGYVDLVLCPHCSREPFRLGEFREMMKGEVGVGIGLDDGCALQIRDDEYRILASLPGAVAHRIECVEGRLSELELAPHDDFRPIAAI